jgi:hypothetical protein
MEVHASFCDVQMGGFSVELKIVQRLIRFAIAHFRLCYGREKSHDCRSMNIEQRLDLSSVCAHGSNYQEN